MLCNAFTNLLAYDNHKQISMTTNLNTHQVTLNLFQIQWAGSDVVQNNNVEAEASLYQTQNIKRASPEDQTDGL